MQPITFSEVVLSNINLCRTVAAKEGHTPKIADNCEAGHIGCIGCPFLVDKGLTSLHPIWEQPIITVNQYQSNNKKDLTNLSESV